MNCIASWFGSDNLITLAPAFVRHECNPARRVKVTLPGYPPNYLSGELDTYLSMLALIKSETSHFVNHLHKNYLNGHRSRYIPFPLIIDTKLCISFRHSTVPEL